MSPYAKLRHARRMLREAHKQQPKHSGPVHAELSALLVAVERLCEVVEGLIGPPAPAELAAAEDDEQV